MKRKTRNFLGIVLCLSLLILLIACIVQPDVVQPDVVGKWLKIDSQPNIEVEFFKDGTLVWSFVPGKYTFPDNRRIKLELLGRAETYKLSFSGDTLTLIGDKGELFILQRVKEKSNTVPLALSSHGERERTAENTRPLIPPS